MNAAVIRKVGRHHLFDALGEELPENGRHRLPRYRVPVNTPVEADAVEGARERRDWAIADHSDQAAFVLDAPGPFAPLEAAVYFGFPRFWSAWPEVIEVRSWELIQPAPGLAQRFARKWLDELH